MDRSAVQAVVEHALAPLQERLGIAHWQVKCSYVVIADDDGTQTRAECTRLVDYHDAHIRFNPEAFQGVLVKEQDLKNTIYRFTLEDGTVVEARGDEEIDYDGELHTAANLFDAIRDGYYGRL